MKSIGSKRDFETLWKTSKALVADFSAEWCGPCKMLEPILKRLEKEHTGVTFVTVDIDKHEKLSDDLKVSCVPTLFFVRKGQVMQRIEGLETYGTLARYVRELLE